MLVFQHHAGFVAWRCAITKKAQVHLSRRERQIMDIIYRRGRVTAVEVRQALPKPPSYSAVRALLRVLEEKGHVKHQEQKLRYVYLPTVPRERARRSALEHMIETFFDGSREQVVARLIDSSVARLSPEELDRLSQLLEKAKKEAVS